MEKDCLNSVCRPIKNPSGKLQKTKNYRGGNDGSYARHPEAGQSLSKAQTCLLGEVS